MNEIINRLFMFLSVCYGWFLATNFDLEGILYGLAVWVVILILFESKFGLKK